MRGSRLGALLFGALLAAAGPTAHAASAPDAWALLVGVSQYPSLQPERQLRGPRNDVLDMRESLGRLAARWRRIIVLADGVEGATGLPTRAAIERAFADLRRDVRAGDFVVVYFSGHGSQQPAARAATEESDGLDEIFLPRDVGRWDGGVGAVRNAITDDRFQAMLAPLIDAGARVWAVFDTCHSGTMTRGPRDAAPSADSEIARAIAPAELGVPGRRALGNAGSTGAGAGVHRARDGLVVFAAAGSHEITPELRLPRGPGSAPRGLFTHALSSALRDGEVSTYADLATEIAARYATMNRSSPTPQFEGVLDAALPATPLLASEPSVPATRLRMLLRERSAAPLAIRLHRVATTRGRECSPDASPPIARDVAPARLRDGETLCAVLENAGREPIDVALLHVAENGTVARMFPLGREANRLAPGEQRRVAFDVVARTPARDELVALAVPVRAGRRAGDLAWLARYESGETSRGDSGERVTATGYRWLALPRGFRTN